MYEQIARNRRRTVLIVVGALLFAAGVGYLVGWIFGFGPFGLVVAFLVMAGLSYTSYRSGDRTVLRAARAVPVTAAEEPRLHNIVEGLSIAAGIPKPAVYVVPEQAMNAFATGRDPEHASVAVTRGLLDGLTRVELEGVVAHEMSHIKDRDILLGTILATLVGSVVLLSEFMLRWFWWGGGRRRGGGGGGGGGGADAILAMVGLLVALLTPLAAQVIRLSLSRRREYLADAEGVMLTRYPPGLAAALRKVAADTLPMRSANNATAHLWLKQPSRVPGERNHWFENLFNTHPPIQERIRILEEM